MIDPSDNISFWYTNEYSDGGGNWRTRVAHFSFGSSDCYAGSNSNCGSNDEYISNVSIGSINNPSGCNQYADYTSLSTNIPLNSSANITVTNGHGWSADQCGIWVDWNRDGDFSDPGETITVSGTSGSGPYTATIQPPATATLGNCVMRIRITYTGDVLPCGVTQYGEVEDYTVNASPKIANIWTGNYNHYWGNSNNWSLGHIPTDDEDVEIPNVNMPCVVDYSDKSCKDLLLNSGAALQIYDQMLTVNGDMDISGTLEMLEADAKLMVMSDITWKSGSTANITTNNAYMYIYGDWNLRSGSNVNLNNGFVDFKGTDDSWIRSYQHNSAFYTLRDYKTDGAKVGFSNLSEEDLTINNLLYIADGAILENWFYDDDLHLKGWFNYYGTFDFTKGNKKVIFDGANQSINKYNSGSGIFGDVTINCTGTASFNDNDIHIVGNLTINGGSIMSFTLPGPKVMLI